MNNQLIRGGGLSCTKPYKMGVQCAEWNSENFMGAHLDAIL